MASEHREVSTHAAADFEHLLSPPLLEFGEFGNERFAFVAFNLRPVKEFGRTRFRAVAQPRTAGIIVPESGNVSFFIVQIAQLPMAIPQGPLRKSVTIAM